MARIRICRPAKKERN